MEALWLYTVENLRNDLTPQVAKGGSLALLTSASNACLDTKPKNIMKDKKKYKVQNAKMQKIQVAKGAPLFTSACKACLETKPLPTKKDRNTKKEIKYRIKNA